MNRSGKHCPCSSRQARPGSVAGPRAPVLPTCRRLQPLQHLLPAHCRGHCCRAGESVWDNTILSAPDCPYLCLSSIPIQEISFSNMLVHFCHQLFLSAISLLLSSTVFLLFGLSCIRYEALCLNHTCLCVKDTCIFQSMSWDTKSIPKLLLMVVFNLACISDQKP